MIFYKKFIIIKDFVFLHNKYCTPKIYEKVHNTSHYSIYCTPFGNGRCTYKRVTGKAKKQTANKETVN